MQTQLLSMLLRGGRPPIVRLAGAAALVAVACLLLLAAVGIGLVAVYLGLEPVLGAAWSALVTAGAALLTAGAALAVAYRLQARTHVPNAAEMGGELVRQYPLQSAAVALAAGAAVGGSPGTREAVADALKSAL